MVEIIVVLISYTWCGDYIRVICRRLGLLLFEVTFSHISDMLWRVSMIIA